jgi:hypothetical protein
MLEVFQTDDPSLGQHDGDDVDPPVGGGRRLAPQVGYGAAGHVRLLGRGDGLLGGAEAVARAGAHFDEHQRATVPAHDVDLAVRAAVVALHDLPAGPFQVGCHGDLSDARRSLRY